MPRKSKVSLENLTISEQPPNDNIDEDVVVVKKITTRERKKKEDKPVEDIVLPTEDIVLPKKKTNAWIEHCKSVKKLHPDMLYCDVLKLAKESYKK